MANANALAQDDANIAFIQNDIAYYAHNNLYMFNKNKVDMRGVISLYPETNQIVVFADKLLELTGGNLLLLLLMTMSISLVLGVGIPTTANYINHACLRMGHDLGGEGAGLRPRRPLLMAHMFVFYLGILADVTPPVALAAYAASTIAKLNFFKTGLYASILAPAGYLGPYMFALHSDHLFVTVKNRDVAAALGVLINFASGVVGMYSLAAGVTGYLRGPSPRYLLFTPLGVVNAVVNPLQSPAVLIANMAALTFAALKK